MEEKFDKPNEQTNEYNDEIYENINFEVLNKVDYDDLNVKIQEKLEIEHTKAKKESEKKINQSLPIISVMAGVLSLFFDMIMCCNSLIVVLAGVLAVTGLVLGIVSLKKGENKGMSVAGIICSSVGLFIAASVILFVVVYYFLSPLLMLFSEQSKATL